MKNKTCMTAAVKAPRASGEKRFSQMAEHADMPLKQAFSRGN